jgi:hypothetical protein
LAILENVIHVAALRPTGWTVSDDVLKRAEAVNAAKAAFRTICTPRYGIRMRVPVKGDDGPKKPIPVIRVILRNIQRSDLNLQAVTKPHYDNIRANITYSRLDSRGRGRVQLTAELPLLYFNYPAPADELANQPRRIRQSELESQPFLQSIPAFRSVHG